MSIHSTCSACQLQGPLRIDKKRHIDDRHLFQIRGWLKPDNQRPMKSPSRDGYGSGRRAGPIRFLSARSLRWPITFLIIWVCTAGGARAQVVPAIRFGPHIAVFGTYNTLKPDYKFYGDLAVYGFSVGGYWQTPHVVGVEVRGSINRWGGKEHQETALAGPRASLHLGPFSPYVAALGGEANSWRWAYWPTKTGPQPKLVENLGPSWQAIGGLDLHVRRHLSIRVAEFSYGQTYLKNWNMTPLTASAGIVYRIH